ncbi:MAG: YesL family protein [Lachnospiraceae bacterium]|nr:YesL family protein [Lachnospiraceae bacterium]
MSNWLNPDNAFFTFMGKAFDMLVINTIWLVLCLPLPALSIVWAGQTGITAFLILTFLSLLPVVPATTAMYYTIVKVIRRERSYAIKEFFRSFKRNFKQGAVFSVIALVLVALLYIDFKYALALVEAQESSGSTYFGVFLVVAILFGGMFTFICPILSRFEMKLTGFIKTAFLMATRHALTTLVLLVIGIGVLLGCYVLLPGIFILPVVGTLLASFMIERVFKKYMPAKEETPEGEEEAGQEHDEWYLE